MAFFFGKKWVLILTFNLRMGYEEVFWIPRLWKNRFGIFILKAC